MASEDTQLPFCLRIDTPSPEVKPSTDDLPLIEKETNTMSQGELDCLRKLFSFPSSIQIRLLEADETIASTRPSEVAFYEATFHVGICFPLHPIIRKILYFYNICPAQLIPNAWRSLIYAIVMWRSHKFILSLNEFRSLFTLCKNSKPNSR